MKTAIFITGIVCLTLFNCGEPLNPETQLFEAIYDNNTDKVKELLDQGIDISECKSEYDESALNYAILTASADMVNLLLDHGAQPDPAKPGDHWSDMSIPLAITLNKMDTAESLIRRGVGVDAISIRKATLLIYASCKGYTGIVQALINSGLIDIDHSGGYHNQTALERAKAQGHDEIVKLLLDAGAKDTETGK